MCENGLYEGVISTRVLGHLLNCSGEYSFNENGLALGWAGRVTRGTHLNKFSKQEIQELVYLSSRCGTVGVT